MMCAQEFHSAAKNNIDLTVIVFNDAHYGVISKSATLNGNGDAPAVRVDITRLDWARRELRQRGTASDYQIRDT